MNAGKKSRRGHVTRHSSTPAVEPAAEPVAAPPAVAVVSSGEDMATPAPAPAPAAPAPAALAPAVTSRPALPDQEYGGVRRSVFDLLKEKYPDLAPPGPTKSAPPAPAKESVAPTRPAERPPEPVKTAPPVKAADPVKTAPPVKAADPVKTEPVKAAEPVKTEPVKAADPVKTAPPVKAADPVKTEPVKAAEPLQEAIRVPESFEDDDATPAEAAREVAAATAVPQNATPAELAAGSAGPLAATSLAAPTAAAPAAPVAARPRRIAGPSRKVLLFWGGVLAALVVGTYALARLKPALTPPAAPASAPSTAPAGGAANGGLSLEPEKVVVGLPGVGAAPPAPSPTAQTLPPPAVPTPADKAPAATKPASEKRDRETAAKAPAKPESQILIEQVPPVLPPTRIGGSQPEYPLEARSAGLEGTVVLFGVIGRDGKVKNARVVRGLSPPLDAAALAAFKTWRFQPATQKGKKVEFKYNAGIEFRINSPTEQVAAPPLAEAPAAEAAAAPPPSVAAPGTPAPLPYGGDFSPPVRITMVWPQKPQGAQMVKGEVNLQLTVTADGSVAAVEVLQGLPQGVTEAAIEAVRQWKFKPARRAGAPVAVYHRVSLRF